MSLWRHGCWCLPARVATDSVFNVMDFTQLSPSPFSSRFQMTVWGYRGVPLEVMTDVVRSANNPNVPEALNCSLLVPYSSPFLST